MVFPLYSVNAVSYKLHWLIFIFLSSPTRDRSWALAMKPQDRQGIPNTDWFSSIVQLVMMYYSWYILLVFSCSVISDSLQPHGLQHARLPCSSPTSGACSNSCPSNQWYHPTISSSVIPFSSCLQSFPASGFFAMSQFFVSGVRSSGALASVLPIFILISFRTDFL